MSNRVSAVGGIVLCGGRSTRMGKPKYLLPFGPETLLQRTVRILGQVVDPVAVVAAQDQELPELPPSVLTLRDEREFLGPLAGLAVGLAAMRLHVGAVYASGCDVPLLKPQFVQRMIDLLEDYDLVLPRDREFHHPLAAVYRTSLEDRIRELISADRMRPVSLIEKCRSRVIDVDDLRDVDPQLDSLRNTNTPQEYQAALRDAEFRSSLS